MIYFLLFLSLLLHGVTFIWLVVIWQRFSALNSKKQELERAEQGISDVLLAYTEQMKDENKRLLMEISNKAVEKAASQPAQTSEEDSTRKSKRQDEAEQRYPDYQLLLTLQKSSTSSLIQQK